MYVYVKDLSAQYFYGAAKVITEYGENTIGLMGYDGTQTDTSSPIKTYKHNNNGMLDIQFVFPNTYTHGVLLLGGSVVRGKIIDGTD